MGVDEEVQMQEFFIAIDFREIRRPDTTPSCEISDVVAEADFGIPADIGADVGTQTQACDSVLGDKDIVRVQVPAAPIEVGASRNENRVVAERLDELPREPLVGAECEIQSRLRTNAHQAVLKHAAEKVDGETRRVDVADIEPQHQKWWAVRLFTHANLQ